MNGHSITRRLLLAQLAGTSAWAQTATTSGPGARLPSAPDDDPLHGLRVSHPRLILLDAALDRLRTQIREVPLARKIYSDLERECERLVSTPAAEFKLSGPRQLLRPQQILDNLANLALVFRISGREPFLRRAVVEMKAVAAFRDWNPSRFAETATITNAVALGYDWLYNALTVEERTLIRTAIRTKGLEPALAAYKRESGWPVDRFNANVICNSGVAMGALAVAGDPANEDDKAVNEQCSAVLRSVLESIPKGLAAYGVEGSWPEGPGYWNSVTTAACVLFSGLQTALGNDFGLSSSHGVDRAARFRIHSTAPSGRTFNFGDSTDDSTPAPAMYWLARRFANPVFAWAENRVIERDGHPEAYDLAWFTQNSKSPQQTPAWPLDAIFRAVDVAVMRSAWDDPNAIFVAVKGGDNKTPQSHLDLGTFVLDAGGVRWAVDLGPDEYEAPGFPGRPRSSYFRVRTEAHNTLVIDSENQDGRGDARVTRQDVLPDLTWVQVDLSRANLGRVRQWTRKVGLAQRQVVLINDVLRSEQPREVIWGMMTDAEIALGGQTATLRKNGWNLAVEIQTPRHAVFDVSPVRMVAPQASNNGFHKLIVRLGEKVTDLDLNIVMTPYRDGQTKPRTSVQFPL